MWIGVIGGCSSSGFEPEDTGADTPVSPPVVVTTSAPPPEACVPDGDRERCDGVDNDCDGEIDEWDPLDAMDPEVRGADQLPLEMVCVLPQTFRLGPDDGELGAMPSEVPVDVTLTTPFWMSPYEVTQSEFVHVFGKNPTRFNHCPSCAQDNVMWIEAAAFLNTLSAAAGLSACYSCTNVKDCTVADELDPYACEGFRFPTEAEWELAARAPEGTMPSGDTLTADDLVDGCNPDHPIADDAWYCANSDRPMPVGMLAPTWRGLYDIAGNVWEWCGDQFEDVAPGGVDPFGREPGRSRLLKGGGHSSDLDNLRVARRNPASEIDGNNHRGFRLVLGEPAARIVAEGR